ncbi:MAG: heparinase II/III domain-containing protein [Solirubrobacterales bacterium]
MPRQRRAQAALAVAAALTAPALGACGGAEDEPGASIPQCAPPLHETFVEAPKEATLAAALEGRFSLRKVKLPLEPPIDWEQNPIDSSSFQGKLQDLGWTDPLLYAYLRGDEAALAQARDIVLDWIAANPFVNPYESGRERVDSKPWIDKVSAERAPVVAWVSAAADCEDLLSARQRQVLGRSLEAHGQYLAGDEHYRETNHGLYVDHGLFLLARLAPELPAAEAWADHAERRFTRNLRSHLAGDEGFWLEHSAAYQVAISRLVERFEELGEIGPELKEVATQLQETAGWVIEPDGKQLLYGDSWLGTPTPDELQTAFAQEGMRWLPRTGLAFVKRREPAAYLAVLASFHSDTHKDADELSFDLYESGTRVVSDTGLYHKDFDEYFDFQDSASAHSVLRTETDVPITDENAYGSGLLARGEGDGWYAMLARNPLLLRQGVTHHRLFLYRPGSALIVHDQVESEVVHTYERLFQLGPEVDVERDEEALRLTGGKVDATVAFDASAPEELELVRGRSEPLQGFVFPGFRQAVPRYTAILRSSAADLEAVTTFALDPAGRVEARLPEAPPGKPGDVTLALAGSRGGRILQVRPDGERLQVAESGP